jgi:mannose-1-phosphate guanylyltransferase
MNKNYFGVIMAGGIGTRFWPLSTSEYPKQFHDILGTGRTFLQQTFDRLKKLIPQDQIYIITLEEYVDLTLEQLPEITAEQIIAEPSGMNTAPCNLYAAKLIQEKNPNANIVVAPSDHVILDESVFIQKLEMALNQSEKEEVLITLGIQPTRPDTGYGYIQYLTEQKNKSEIKKVKTFTEKPGLELAEAFCKSGDFLWNAGIFVWKAETILHSFQHYLPEMYESFDKISHLLSSEKGKEKVKDIYSKVQMISIDNGILEKASNVYVIPSSFGWSDLGTWKSLYENSDKNREQNVKHGKHVIMYNTKDSLIYTSQNKAVIVDGLENYIVVDTKKALLICPMDKDQAIKAFVSDLKLNKGEKFV